MARSVHPIVRQIIDRDCHVSMSHREVVRHVISRLRNGRETFRALAKADRRRLIEDCIQVHRENWALYCEVMRGTPRRTPENGGEGTVPAASLSGKEVARLMRRHHRTIASLAFRLGTTQKRIRQARQRGLDDPLAVRDWIEAITGVDPGPIPARYVIRRQAEECECSFCGCPLYVGDAAFEYVGGAFCSVACCRQSRGWN